MRPLKWQKMSISTNKLPHFFAEHGQWFLCIDLFSMSRSRFRWESHFRFYVLSTYVRLYWSWELVFFYSPVRTGYIRKVSVHLVQKYFSYYFSTDSISCSERGKKEYDEKNTNTRHLQDRDKTVLLLATQWQGKSTLRCRCQSTGTIADTLPPP